MAIVNVRYVAERKNRDGSLRRYWMRPGFDAVRLPGSGWAERAEHLNNEADAGRYPRRKAKAKMQVRVNTVAYWCDLYENTTETSVGVARPFASLAYNTRKNYLRQLKLIKANLGHIPIEGITRKVLVEYLEAIPSTLALRRISRNVWLNLFSLATARGGAKDNPVKGLILAENPRRTELCLPDDIAAWLHFCDSDRG